MTLRSPRRHTLRRLNTYFSLIALWSRLLCSLPPAYPMVRDIVSSAPDLLRNRETAISKKPISTAYRGAAYYINNKELYNQLLIRYQLLLPADIQFPMTMYLGTEFSLNSLLFFSSLLSGLRSLALVTFSCCYEDSGEDELGKGRQ